MESFYDYKTPIIDGVDTTQGILRFGGKKDRYFRNLRKFAKSLIGALPPYESFISGTETENAKTELHSIKGVAGNLGMLKLYEAIKAFEASIHEGAPAEDLYKDVAEILEGVSKAILEETAVFEPLL